MSDPPVSVLLPTVRPTPVIDDVAAQLREDDELLVCCDAEDDPVADADLPDRARLVVAGEPERCSGKANALAAGTEAARHERLVWTDDDFEHPPDWLATLRADYERQGPTTEVPFFRGGDPLSLLLEPLYVLTGSQLIGTLGAAWGGAVIFERGDLSAPPDAPRVDVEGAGSDEEGVGDDVEGAAADGAEVAEQAERTAEDAPDDRGGDAADGDEAVFLAELCRTFSDDGLLTQYLDTTPADRVRTVEPPTGPRHTLERHARWTTGFERLAPLRSAVVAVAFSLLAVASVLLWLPTFVLLTAGVGALYAHLGVRRWTVLLAWPAVVASVPLGIYVRSRQTLTWGGRRYRWPSLFDVEVLED